MDEIEAKLLSTMDKTAASMKKNAEMLSDAVSDDFPSRILKGGERVVGNFDKTFDRMAKLASDLYGWVLRPVLPAIFAPQFQSPSLAISRDKVLLQRALVVD